MRIIRLAPIALPLVIFLGATCVTRFDQRGDAGPWTGEFVNTAWVRVSGYEAKASVADANGIDAGAIAVNICPEELERGDSGAFEMRLASPRAGLALPLTASPPSINRVGGAILELERAGLIARVVSTDAATSTAVVELHNVTSEEAYPSGRVCAVSRDASGSIVSVSAPADLPSLNPDQSAMQTLAFTTLVGATDVEVHTRASLAGASGSGSLVNDLGPFLVTLPRGWHYEPMLFVDSFMGSIVSDTGAELGFVYGLAGDLSAFVSDGRYAVLHEKIDGFDATIVYPRFGDVGTVGVSIVNGENPRDHGSFLMTGENLTPAQRRDALAIFRSIDFTN